MFIIILAGSTYYMLHSLLNLHINSHLTLKIGFNLKNKNKNCGETQKRRDLPNVTWLVMGMRLILSYLTVN